MRVNLVKLLVSILVPVFIWGWGNDVEMLKVTSTANQFPVAYDILWLNDTTMLAAIANTRNTDTTEVRIFRSTNGQDWSLVYNQEFYNRKILNIEIEKDSRSDSLYVMYHFTNSIWIAKLSSLFGGSWYYYRSDSCTQAFMETASRGDTSIIYLGILKQTSTHDTLKILKIVNYGTTSDSVKVFWSAGNVVKLKDLDIGYKSDTIYIYYTYEYLSGSNNNDISFLIYRDYVGTNIRYYSSGIIANTADNEINPSVAVNGTNVLWVWEVIGELKYSFSRDYGGTRIVRDFPFNTPTSEGLPVISRWLTWYGYFFIRGFDMAFVRGDSVFFSYSSVSGDTLLWYEPTFVSDQSGYSTYFLNNNYNYKLKIAEKIGPTNIGPPMVMWHYDYWHFVPPYWFVYDSTSFYLDNYSAVRIVENQLEQNSIKVSQIITDGSIMLKFGEPLWFDNDVRIFDVSGREVLSRRLRAGDTEAQIGAGDLRAGIYFISIEGKGISYKGKFVKVK